MTEDRDSIMQALLEQGERQHRQFLRLRVASYFAASIVGLMLGVGIGFAVAGMITFFGGGR